MPPIGGIAGTAAFSSTLSATIVSVVNTRDAIDAAFLSIEMKEKLRVNL